MKKIYLLIFFFLFHLISVKSQIPLNERKNEPSGEKFSDRLFYGGIFGLQFGTYTYIEINPIIGYKITNRLIGGIGLKYQYLEYKDDYYKYSSNTYGGGPFARFTVIDGLFLHFDYEILNLDVPNLYTGYSRQNIYSVFIGAGYRQMIGSRSSMDILIKYNINESSVYSPYQNPLFQIGFGFGL